MRLSGFFAPCALVMFVMLATAPAHALSRVGDGDVELSTVDGQPCFAVERYLGPISLFWTRKFRPVEGQFTVAAVRVLARTAPHGLMWSIETPGGTAGWALDRGQCMALGAMPEGAQVTIGEQGLPLPPGWYEVWLYVRDLHRGGGGQLTALFCIDDDGRMRHGTNDGGRVQCGAVVPAGSRVQAPAPLLEKP